ncbi:hypothetical protein LQZ19_07285 [Treponema primitia]|uniref:hypothetical protein n=1 Tax=Treponema primitia TaxID=88058 RepID=UPI003980A958
MQGPWIADLTAMTCRHLTNNMILQFVKDGKFLKPEIKDMPLKLLSSIAKKKTDVSYLEKLIEEGKNVFLRAYFETKIENSPKPL